MGDKPVHVSADDLRIVGESFDMPALTVQSAFNGLRTRLASVGQPWGDDETGTTFANIYVPAQEKTFELMVDVDNGLTDLKTGFLTMADNYEAAENANRQ